jgi:hypothetical protein
MKGVKAVASSLAAKNLRPASGGFTKAVHALLWAALWYRSSWMRSRKAASWKK